LTALVNATGGMDPITYGSTNQDRFSIPCGQSHSTMALGTRLGPGHAHLKNFESIVSEMPFPGLWGDILQNSDGQKTTL
jgi:hypothetical protein